MEAVVAGWLAGYLMAIGSTIALTVLVVRQPAESWVQKTLGDSRQGLMAAVLIFMMATLGWTMAGLILGSAYELLNLGDQPGFLGSPSAPFLIAIFGLAVMAAGPLVIIFQRSWWLWCSMSILFVACFGWLMPIIAGR